MSGFGPFAFGGYVDPPSHLKKNARETDQFQTLPPSIHRTIPDYDYSLFRYSKVAVSFLALILLTGLLLAGLTFWQGPWGINRGPNGLQDGVPREFVLQDQSDEPQEPLGLPKDLRNLRAACFVIGFFPLLFLLFVIPSQPRPALIKATFFLSAFLLFVVLVLACIAFGIGIDRINDSRECVRWTFNQMHFAPSNTCVDRQQLGVAAIASDAAVGFSAVLLIVALIFTTLKSKWAWGPGSIPANKPIPVMDYPPRSHFTKLHETRRAYTWLLIFIFAASLTLQFVFMILLHEHRQAPVQVDSNNRLTEKSGWPRSNNRLRVAVSLTVAALAVVSLVNKFGPKRRYLAYTLAVLMFFAAVGAFVVFGLDVARINDADDLACPDGLNGIGNPGVDVRVDCKHIQFQATAFVDFMLAIFLLVFVIYEFLFRVNATWDSFYFYADSQWLRSRAIWADRTDREAYDWTELRTPDGYPYFYSPTLGIKSMNPPNNFIGGGAPLPLAGGLDGGLPLF